MRRDEVRVTAGVYTANGAYLSWEEKSKGALEPGKLADMIVLPFDPLTASPETILMTSVGGKLVYQKPRGLDAKAPAKSL